MIFCDQCGNRLPAGANFCPECGARQSQHNMPGKISAAKRSVPREIDGRKRPTGEGKTTTARHSSAVPRTHTSYPSVKTLKTNRGFLKTFLLSLLTFGIYGMIVMASVVRDLNTIAGPHDGKKSMSFWLMAFVVFPLTLGLGILFWGHSISDRIGDELRRRRISYNFSSSSFWIWGVLFAVIFGIGPAIYQHKLFKAMNYLAMDYNEKAGLA